MTSFSHELKSLWRGGTPATAEEDRTGTGAFMELCLAWFFSQTQRNKCYAHIQIDRFTILQMEVALHNNYLRSK